MCTPQRGAQALGSYDGNDYLSAMSAGSDGRIVFSGSSFGSFEETNLGIGDLVGVMLDTSLLATPSPTTSASSTATPVSPPAPTATSPPSAEPISPPATQIAPTPDPSPPAMPATPPGATQEASNVIPIAVGVASAIAGAALIAVGFCLRKRRIAKKNGIAQQVHPPVAGVDRGNPPLAVNQNPAPPPPPYMYPVAAFQQTLTPPPPPYLHAVAVAAGPAPADIDGGGVKAISPFSAVFPGPVLPGAEPTTHVGKEIGDGISHSRSKGDAEHATEARKSGSGGGVGIIEGEPEQTTHARLVVGGVGTGAELEQGNAVDGSAERAFIDTTSTVNISTGEQDKSTPAYGGGGLAGAAFFSDEPKPTLAEIGPSSSSDRRASSDGIGLGQAVGDAAHELARNCHIPGVSEAAAAVAILVNMVTDNRDTKNGTEASLRRCRSIVMMLQRAAKVLGKVRWRNMM